MLNSGLEITDICISRSVGYAIITDFKTKIKL